jgi:hypothetical protein
MMSLCAQDIFSQIKSPWRQNENSNSENHVQRNPYRLGLQDSYEDQNRLDKIKTQKIDPENKTDSARLGLLGNAKSGTNDEENRCTDNICWRSSCEPKPSQQQFAQIPQNPKGTQ